MTFADAVGYGESMGMRVDVVTRRDGSEVEDRDRRVICDGPSPSSQSWCSMLRLDRDRFIGWRDTSVPACSGTSVENECVPRPRRYLRRIAKRISRRSGPQ